MSRYARRTDTTHAPIRDALRNVGATVLDMSRLGDDAPDLAVGWRGRTVFVECKTPTRKDGGVKDSKVSDGQREFARTWRGDAVIVATNPQQAVEQLVIAVTRAPPADGSDSRGTR